jgi:hypothetical protein
LNSEKMWHNESLELIILILGTCRRTRSMADPCTY